MVLICAPLSRRALQLSLLIFTLATFSTLYQPLNGPGFKKGVCLGHVMPWEPPPGSSWALLLSPEGSGLPSLTTVPSLQFNCIFSLEVLTSGQLQINCSGQAAMIAALLLHLGILHCPLKVHHELFGNPVNTVRVLNFLFLLPLGAFLFQVHQAHSGCFRYWLVPFELPQGEETSSFWFSSVINCLAPWVSG